MSETITRAPVVLEPASQAFAEATAKPPFLYQLTPAEARKVLDDVQAAPIDKLPVEDRWITVPAEVGDVGVRIIRPPDAAGTLPVILYIHGGGWMLGNADTHDRLVRELAVGTGAAVVFVEYDRSPEARTWSRSSRGTPPPSGSSARAPPTSSTRIASPLRATRSAAT
jgi:acetyl esterase